MCMYVCIYVCVCVSVCGFGCMVVCMCVACVCMCMCIKSLRTLHIYFNPLLEAEKVAQQLSANFA